MAENGDSDEVKPPAEAARARSVQQNEWTASDRRGPLGAAKAEEAATAEAAGTSEPPPFGPQPAPVELRPEPTPEPVSEHMSKTSSEPTRAEVPPAEPLESAAPERRRVPVLPIVAALVVGAIIGAASAALVYRFGGDQGAGQGDVTALAARLDALEKRPDPQPELDQLKASIAAVQKPAAPVAAAFDPAPLQQKIAGLESDIAALKQQDADHSLGDKVAALGGTVAALQAQGAAVQAQGADVKGLDAKVTDLAAAIDGLKQQDQSTAAGIAALQSGEKSLEAKTGAPALAVAADSLAVAIAQGRPYAGQVDALSSLGADPAKVAVLRENADKGVPSAQVLATQFAPLADPIIATAGQAPANAGFGDRLKSGLFGLVQVRRSDATTGDDVPSRVARIEADLAHDDVAGAYDTWTGLPAAAKAKSDAWGALAKTQVEAMGAARALQQQAIAALGGRKS